MKWPAIEIAMLFAVLGSPSQETLEESKEAPRNKIEFRFSESRPDLTLIEAEVADTKTMAYLPPTADITSLEFVEASAVKGLNEESEIKIKLTKAGTRKMSRLSSRHIGRPMAIILDGKVVSAPNVNAPIINEIRIDLTLSSEEITKLVEEINSEIRQRKR